jgi:mRNA interferase MazF
MRGRSSVWPGRGEIWMLDLEPTVGHEQGGIRPALVVSASRFNRSPAGLVVIAPITTTDRSLVLQIRVDPPEGGLMKPSFIMTDQVRTVSKMRLKQRLGIALPVTMVNVE